MTISDEQMNLDKAYCAELAELDKREGLTMLQVGREDSLQVVLSRHCADYISEVERLRAEVNYQLKRKVEIIREHKAIRDENTKLQAENAELRKQLEHSCRCLDVALKYGPAEEA